MWTPCSSTPSRRQDGFSETQTNCGRMHPGRNETGSRRAAEARALPRAETTASPPPLLPSRKPDAAGLRSSGIRGGHRESSKHTHVRVRTHTGEARGRTRGRGALRERGIAGPDGPIR